MPKLRVYQLARELNRDNAEIIRELQHMGVPVTSHSNTVEDRLADRLRKELGVFVPSQEAAVAAVEEIVEVVEVPAPVETPPPQPVHVEEAPRVEAKAEPKVEEKAPEPVAKVAAPPPPPVTAPVTPPPVVPKVEPPPVIQTTPSGGRISPPPTRLGPAVPPKIEPPHEQRKTMQQIVQERLRQEHRLPPSPPPGQRRPFDRPGQRPGSPAPGQPRHPSAPGFQNRGAAPAGPAGSRPWTRPAAPVPTPPSEQRRAPVHERGDRTQRYERQAAKKLASPYIRPQPKLEPPREFRKVTLTEGLTVKDLAEKLGVLAKDLQRKLMDRGVLATINQTLDKEMAKEIAKDFNAEADFVTFEESVMLDAVEISASANSVPRPPVVTIMGHVDHGKTSLLDAIRKTRVTEQEAGGITQHIGAYQVKVQERKITFLDTPGHEAFTLMRARGAKVTDIVVLVVAADDGVMPQTIESIAHTKAAKVPIVVAINKIDKPGVNPERVKRELAERGLQAEDWGGDTPTVEVSAKTGKNLPLLLEIILLVADLQNLKADPTLPAMGAVLEAKIDRGRGNVATVLVQNGTLRVGDNFVAGAVYGKVRAMFDENAKAAKEAAPSTPVEVLGLEGLPMAGDSFLCLADDKKARQIASNRQEKLRDIALAKTSRLTLDQLHKQLTEGEIKEVPLLLKCDVQGSQEALTDMLNKLSTDKVKVRLLRSEEH